MYKKFPINLLKRKKEGIYPLFTGHILLFFLSGNKLSGLRHRGLLLAAVPGGIAQGVSGNDVQVPDHRLLGLCRISALYGHVDLVVGLLAFALGVCVTVLCVRLRGHEGDSADEERYDD